MIYIAEAHTIDGWQTDSNEAEGIRITQPQSLEERIAVARRSARQLGLPLPLYVDEMNDTACRAFAAWPERLFVVDASGTLTYCGGPGPYDFDVAEASTALTHVCPPT